MTEQTEHTEQIPAPTKTESRVILSQLNAMFPDTDGETPFNSVWKADVAQNPAAYPQIMAVLSVAIPETARKFVPADYTAA